MFESARLKLTTWYLVLIMLVSVLFSCFIYSSVNAEFERFEQIDRLIQERSSQGLPIPYSLLNSHIEPELINQARTRLVSTLALINLSILVLSGIAGYFLAGRTLRPIKEMVDEQHRFITDASHELRTPLTSLRAEIEVDLLNQNLTFPEAKSLIKSNLEEVIHLQSLSDNLLDLTHYEKLSDRKKFTEVSLQEILDESLKNVTGQAKKKKIEINREGVNAILEGSKISLIELFTILMDNAIKYSNIHSVVTVQTKIQDRFAVISISDNGIGIDPQDLPHIFDRFYRADKSRSKQIEGFGLGLAIAHKIVVLHKGLIKAKSKVKEGTTFTVALPRIK